MKTKKKMKKNSHIFHRQSIFLARKDAYNLAKREICIKNVNFISFLSFFKKILELRKKYHRNIFSLRHNNNARWGQLKKLTCPTLAACEKGESPVESLEASSGDSLAKYQMVAKATVL